MKVNESQSDVIGKGLSVGVGSNGPAALEAAAFGLTLGLSCLACALNAAALAALLSVGESFRRRRGGQRGSPSLTSTSREGASGVPALTGLEVGLNCLLAGYLTSQHDLPPRAGLVLHGAQTVRNHWLLCVTVYRAAALLRPSCTVAVTGRRAQAAVLIGLSILAAVVLGGVDLGGSVADVGSDNTEEVNKTGNETAKATALSAVRAELRRYLSFACFGVLLPGLAILILTCRIAYSLRVRYAHHSCSKRASKMVLLMAGGFVLLEFPFALCYVVTAGYVLQGLGGPGLNPETLHLLEHFTNWGGVFQPMDSCLNFFLLTRYSRSVGRNRCHDHHSRPPQRRHDRLRAEAGCGSNEAIEMQRFLRPDDRFG